GRDAVTPALVVENASRGDERRIKTTLAGLGEVAKDIAGPALLIVGEAMALAVSGAAEIEAAAAAQAISGAGE
ncbi:MAG TPA: uroporphyrinogen-III C-methyltransferase, partial [Phenylobacterium sp.]